MSAPIVAGAFVPVTAQISGTDLLFVSVLALACFGLPGVAALLYLRRRANG